MASIESTINLKIETSEIEKKLKRIEKLCAELSIAIKDLKSSDAKIIRTHDPKK